MNGQPEDVTFRSQNFTERRIMHNSQATMQIMDSFNHQLNKQLKDMDSLAIDTFSTSSPHPDAIASQPFYFHQQLSPFSGTLDSPTVFASHSYFDPLPLPSHSLFLHDVLPPSNQNYINTNIDKQPSRLTLDFSFLDPIHTTNPPFSYTHPSSPSTGYPYYPVPSTPFLDSPSFTDDASTPNINSATSASGMAFFYAKDETSPEGVVPKKYPCPHPGCTRVFPRSYNLKSHLLCHTGQKTHICDLCKSAFARKHDVSILYFIIITFYYSHLLLYLPFTLLSLVTETFTNIAFRYKTLQLPKMQTRLQQTRLSPKTL